MSEPAIGPVETHCPRCGHEWTHHHNGYDSLAHDGAAQCFASSRTEVGSCGCRYNREQAYLMAYRTEREMHNAWRKRAEEAEARPVGDSVRLPALEGPLPDDELATIEALAAHHIPYYAYGDNEAACDMAHRLFDVAKVVGRLRLASRRTEREETK